MSNNTDSKHSSCYFKLYFIFLYCIICTTYFNGSCFRNFPGISQDDNFLHRFFIGFKLCYIVNTQIAVDQKKKHLV